MNRWNITDTETYNGTGLKVIDYPEQIAQIARTHVVAVRLEDLPEYRSDLYINRIKSRISKACKDIDLPVTIVEPGRRGSSACFTVRALDEREIAARESRSRIDARNRRIKARQNNEYRTA